MHVDATSNQPHELRYTHFGVLFSGAFKLPVLTAVNIDGKNYEALGKELIVDRQPEQPGDVRQTFADVSRARAELGFEPKTPFREGLARFVAWLRSR